MRKSIANLMEKRCQSSWHWLFVGDSSQFSMAPPIRRPLSALASKVSTWLRRDIVTRRRCLGRSFVNQIGDGIIKLLPKSRRQQGREVISELGQGWDCGCSALVSRDGPARADSCVADHGGIRAGEAAGSPVGAMNWLAPSFLVANSAGT